MDSMNRRKFFKIGSIGLTGLAAANLAGCSDDSNSGNSNRPNGPSRPSSPINLNKDYRWGDTFTPETLALTPGTNTEEINLNWYSDRINPHDGIIKVRFFDYDKDFIEAAGSARDASAGKSAHKVTVKGLKADTEYSYWVSDDGQNWSVEYTYRTPQKDKFRFATIGDPQLTQYRTSGQGMQDSTSKYPAPYTTTFWGWLETMSNVGLKNVNFVAGVGDQVDLTGNGDETEYRYFFTPPELRSIPWAPAIGNHDRHYPFRYHYNIPNELEFEPLLGSQYGNGTNQQYADVEAAGHYWYRYNNALFVVLNTSAYPASKADAAPYIERFDETLKAAKADSPGYTWLFVQHHKSTASVADHCADRDIQYYVEAGFEALMTEHDVDFVLAGHDHVYARSYPLIGKKGGEPSEPDIANGGGTITNPHGTIYVTMTTGSGLKYYDLYNQSGNLYVKNNDNYPYLAGGEAGSVPYMGGNDANTTSNKDTLPWTNYTGILPLSNTECLQSKIPSFTIVDVEGNKVTFNTYGCDAPSKSIDTFTVTK